MSVKKHIDHISESRLQPYIELCKHNNENLSEDEVIRLAISTYNAIQHRSCIFFSIIQEIEITVRNEMSAIIKKDLAPNNDLRKYFCFLAFNQESKLSETSQKQLIYTFSKLLNTKTRFLRREDITLQNLINNNINENDIVAALTFGFWVHLLNNNTEENPNYLFWSNLFYQKLFENRFPSNLDMFYSLRNVLSFRNQLYHQDTVWKSKNIKRINTSLQNLKRKYTTFTECLKKISPYRYNLRSASTLQQFQNEFNFDEDLFISEINKLKESLSEL